MKYIYGTLATLTAMMLTLTACTAESNETDTAQTRQMLFDATVGTGGATTRTVNTSLQTTSISVGNTVGAFIYRQGKTEDTGPEEIDIENFGHKKNYGYTNKLFTCVDGTSQLYSPTQPIFPQSGTTSVDIYAYAPYDASYGTDWATTLKTFTVKTDQSSEADYIASDLLWTKFNTDDATIQKDETSSHYTIFKTPFSHKLTQVQINVEYGDGVPAGTLNNIPVKLVNVFTEGTINLTNGTVTASTRGSEGVTVFTYKDAVAPATPAVKSGTAIIYPHTADELTAGGAIQIEVNGFTYTAALKTTNITELVAGKKYQYNVTVSSTGITFSAAISPWDSSEPVRPAEAELPD